MLSLKRLLLAAAILSVPTVSNVFADVLDFEDLIGQAQLPSNYGGLTWDNNWTYYDWSQPPFDASSGNVRIYTHNFGGYVDFGSDVTFLGSWVASADVGQEMYWEGYNDGVKVFESTHLNGGDAAFINVNWNVDYVNFVSTSFNHFIIDDFSYDRVRGGGGGNEDPAVPEPATLCLFGLGAIGLAGRRFRRKTA